MAPRKNRKPTRKPDRFTNPTSTRAETLSHFTLAPFDKASREADEKWGIDRLPELVSVETAAIWAKTMANLNAAIEATFAAEDPDQVLANLQACVASGIRGFAVMDAEATREGAKPASREVMEYKLLGAPIGIMADDAAWPAIKAERPDLRLYTMREVAVALEAFGGATVNEAKKHLPKAEIKAIKPKPDYAAGGDAIDF